MLIDIGHRLEADLRTQTEVPVSAYTSMFSRHGLIAGATGTGKSKTLQLLTEQLSDQGVPTFLSDLKGDLRSLEEVTPVRRLSLTGNIGEGLRIPVDTLPATLWARMIDATPVQESVLDAILGWAHDFGHELSTLDDFLELLRWFSTSDGYAAIKRYGGAAPQTLTVIIRKVMRIKREGEQMFGRPVFDTQSLFDVTEDGKGVVNILDLTDAQEKPQLFAAAMMWLLTETYRRSPEVGQVPKPRLVYFFDEAHLLFQNASKGLVDTVERTVRMSRSKGIGVFFASQTPADLPDPVLSQLGNRIQHALRAFTPKDAKAVRETAMTFPTSAVYDIRSTLTTLGTAQALTSVLGPDGAPTETVVVRVNAPRSLRE